MPSQNAICSTNELANAFVGIGKPLIPGPVWTSFEQFRMAGASGLDELPINGVATLRTKAGTFRILRDADFQGLLGLASDVCRLQKGLKLIMQAAKVVVKHPDEEHVRLLIQSASLIAESPELPQRQGHESLYLTPSEVAEEANDDFDLETAKIPRPW